MPLFGEHDTRDELGIGSVRDAFADTLFPGTSTITTRARYFLLVPWTYQRLEVCLKPVLRCHQPNVVRSRGLSDIHNPCDCRKIKMVVPLDTHHFVCPNRQNGA